MDGGTGGMKINQNPSNNTESALSQSKINFYQPNLNENSQNNS